MAAPIPLAIRNALFACCIILPAAAATAAYPYKGKSYAFIGVIVGLLAIAMIGVLLFQLT